MRALNFGARMKQPGYNIFVSGPRGSGKRSAVKRVLARMAAEIPQAPDWAYVHNFAEPHRPQALRMRAGMGAELKTAMEGFVAGLREVMPRLFTSTLHIDRRTKLEKKFQAAIDAALERLRHAAEAFGFLLVDSDEGVNFVPARDGLALADTEYRALPKTERDRLEARKAELISLRDAEMRKLVGVRDEIVEQLQVLDREMGEAAIRNLMAPLFERFADVPAIDGFLKAVYQDAVMHCDALQALARGEADDDSEESGVPFHRYQINLIADNGQTQGAPVISLDQPSLSRLVGKVEHVPLLLTTITDYMYVRAGALHAANGGFLLIDALALLQQDVAWDALKRSLRDAVIAIQNLAEATDRSYNVTIQPQPIPLNVKIVLFGEPWLFYRLRDMDPEFADWFKIQADFSATADRTNENCTALLRVMSDVSRQDGLRPLDRTGAARMLDEASRNAGDAEKIAVRTSRLADLMREADLFARERQRNFVSGQDVALAVAAKDDRAGRLKAMERELIRRGTMFIDTTGAAVGQVNALTVLSMPGYAFGVPARITAQVRPGPGCVLDIERLAEFSGPSHAKGVHILAGYLNGHYSHIHPLSLSASVAFEQSYGPIDGDSASAAELLAILSAIANVPLRQEIAITGSINQHGVIQPIGGVNEKIEGFFDACLTRGLQPGNGVIVPRANLANLMLRDDVVEAARQGRFSVYAIDTINDAIEILTGMTAGMPAQYGAFSAGSFNRLVAERLLYFARPRRLRPIRLDGVLPF